MSSFITIPPALARTASCNLVWKPVFCNRLDSDGLTEAQRTAADVNDDGKIDAKDASAVLAYYALVSTASGDIPTLLEFARPKVQ